MPAQSGIRSQLRTMIIYTMCKSLPVECVHGHAEFWNCPAWKLG